MCGIFGAFLFDENINAYQFILNGITVLQHRGQDAAGISTSKDNIVFTHKNIGKVEEIFKNPKNINLVGNYGIGHVRYSTTGVLTVEQSQPLYTNIPFGISIVHNGNLTNADAISSILTSNNIRINSKSDSDVLLNYFGYLFKKSIEKGMKKVDAIFEAVNSVMISCKGSYSAIIMINGFGLVVFRDPNGIRPLCFGKNDFGYIFSSESVAIDSNYIRDVAAGECLIIEKNGVLSKSFTNQMAKPCLFEYIYFARPESIVDGILVYQARKNMGDALANNILKKHPDILSEIDVVMPVPDSARISSLRVSYLLNKPYCEGLIKNNYIGRTFIMPNQEQRKKNLKLKLNTIDQEFLNKNVLLVDDSIVRGNTSIQLINLVRNAGAKRIIFASIAPPVIYPNYYGISIPTSNELIANGKTNEEIRNIIGADYLIYNDLNDVLKCCKNINPDISAFETSCFDGTYL